MVVMSIPSLLLCARLILLLNVPDLSSAKPAPYRNVPHSHNHLSNGVYTNETSSGSQPSSYWVANIERRGAAAFNPDPTGYPVYRNVKDYGAVGSSSPCYFRLLHLLATSLSQMNSSGTPTRAPFVLGN